MREKGRSVLSKNVTVRQNATKKKIPGGIFENEKKYYRALIYASKIATAPARCLGVSLSSFEDISLLK